MIYSAKRVPYSVRLMLTLLADSMDTRRNVSVPRARLASALNVHPARITEWVARAHKLGLLDTVVAGRPGVTAVYQGMFPDDATLHALELGTAMGTRKPPGRRGTADSTKRTDGDGAADSTKQTPVHGPGDSTPKTPIYGTAHRSPISKHNPTAPAVFSTGDCQGELKSNGAAIGESGAAAEPAGPLTVDPGISPLMRFSSEAEVSSACTKLTGPGLPETQVRGSAHRKLTGPSALKCQHPDCTNNLFGVERPRNLCRDHWANAA